MVFTTPRLESRERRKRIFFAEIIIERLDNLEALMRTGMVTPPPGLNMQQSDILDGRSITQQLRPQHDRMDRIEALLFHADEKTFKALDQLIGTLSSGEDGKLAVDTRSSFEHFTQKPQSSNMKSPMASTGSTETSGAFLCRHLEAIVEQIHMDSIIDCASTPNISQDALCPRALCFDIYEDDFVDTGTQTEKMQKATHSTSAQTSVRSTGRAVQTVSNLPAEISVQTDLCGTGYSALAMDGVVEAFELMLKSGNEKAMEIVNGKFDTKLAEPRESFMTQMDQLEKKGQKSKK